jgi:hypothetical protein
MSCVKASSLKDSNSFCRSLRFDWRQVKDTHHLASSDIWSGFCIPHYTWKAGLICKSSEDPYWWFCPSVVSLAFPSVRGCYFCFLLVEIWRTLLSGFCCPQRINSWVNALCFRLWDWKLINCLWSQRIPSMVTLFLITFSHTRSFTYDDSTYGQ